MSSVHACVQENSHLFLRLPSDLLKLVEIKANSIIEIAKFGSFSTNSLLGRPYYYTYELLEKQHDETFSRLKPVSANELNAEVVTGDATSTEPGHLSSTNGASDGYDLVASDGTIIMKNNRLTIDDASRQNLSHEEIEELKKSAGGKEIIEKILANHTALDEKTVFAKAKYTLRKTKKYVKRFTVLPMNMEYLITHMMEKEAARIMELRQDTLGLICAWSNAHRVSTPQALSNTGDEPSRSGRWLVVDDTGGLVVAAIAEKMGILYPISQDVPGTEKTLYTEEAHGQNPMKLPDAISESAAEKESKSTISSNAHRDFPIPSNINSVTALHPAVQPNLSVLKLFGYDTNQPDTTHPLHDHLKALSFLQLLHPDEDPLYHEPEDVSDATLHSWKSGKRGAYWKKRRRWERCKSIIDETRAGEFDGLVIASTMDPASILACAAPLVRGGGHVVVYSPTLEPLVSLLDLYSKERRTAYIQHIMNGEKPDSEDFPVDPRTLLAPTLQTSRAREWQVLPRRTHPLMTTRGGAEGYLFTARRVLPLEGGVEARGNFTGRKRKAADTVQETK